MVNFAKNKGPQEALFKSERSVLSKTIKSSNTSFHPSPDEVMHIEMISFDAKVKISLCSAKKYKVRGTIGSTLKIQVPACLLLDTSAGANHILKSTV